MSKDKMQKKIGYVMREFRDKKLHSSSGQLVKNKKQALAIAYSEARKRLKNA
jgi:hypothetical protein